MDLSSNKKDVDLTGASSEAVRITDDNSGDCSISDANCLVPMVRCVSNDGKFFVVEKKVAREFKFTDAAIERAIRNDESLLLENIDSEILPIMIKWVERDLVDVETKKKFEEKGSYYIDRFGFEIPFGEEAAREDFYSNHPGTFIEAYNHYLETHFGIGNDVKKVGNFNARIMKRKTDGGALGFCDMKKVDSFDDRVKKIKPNVEAPMKSLMDYCGMSSKYGSADCRYDDDETGVQTIDLRQWEDELLNLDPVPLFQLVRAASDRKMEKLQEVGCQVIANMIKGKTPQELRQTFNIRRRVFGDE